jgi:large subunit ribosomal protein L21
MTMFAVVRTGGKQYRVAAGDKIAVEKIAGEAGDTVVLGDVLLAGEGGEMKDAAKVKVAAEIIAQAKSEKVVVFKKRRRHNYRRKQGHRQQMTLLRIVQVGDSKAEAKKAAPEKAKHTPSAPIKGGDVADKKAHVEAPAKAGATAKAADEKKAPAKKAASSKAEKAPAKKPAAKKADSAEKKPAAKKPAAKKAPAKKPATKK